MIITALVSNITYENCLFVRVFVLELKAYFIIHWIDKFGCAKIGDVFELKLEQLDSDSFQVLQTLEIENKMADDIRVTYGNT